MVLSEDSEDYLCEKHRELCNKLNLLQTTSIEAWESFKNIKTNYTLEGDPLHSLGCAIFVACRKSTTPTVGRSVVQGNCVNLTSLLRYCNLSLAQFFDKIKKWADMANMSQEFKQSINSLEANFAVSCNIFKEYNPIFNKIFKSPTEIEPSKQYRNRKQKLGPCTTTKLFEFTWNLFVTIKGDSSSYNEDLVTSYHLLLACCDLVFKNAFLADRRDLLNPQFTGLPSNWSHPDYVAPNECPCIIDILLGSNASMSTDAKYIKQYSFKNFIKKLFTENYLHGDKENFTGILDQSNFDQNNRNISKLYENQLLKKGDFDERIFLAEYRRRLLLKEKALSNWQSTSLNEAGDTNMIDSPKFHQYGEVVQRPPDTPLTGRKYLGPKESDESNPLSTASQSISKLQAILAGRQAAPSESLLQIFRSCARDPIEKVKEIIRDLGMKFVTAYTQNSELQLDCAKQRLQIGVTLFYKFIEKILQNEKKIHQDISALVEKNVFYECTLACSLEIVIYSYNSQKKFPWILEALQIQPFDFVRVIELIVRSKDQLSRDSVKHLNWVEETIMESLIWKTNSVFWKYIQQAGQDIPKFEEIALPGNLVYTKQMLQNNSVQKLSEEQNATASPLPSPSPSAVDRFESPVGNNTPVKKQLFPKQQKTPIHLGNNTLTGTKALKKQTFLVLTGDDGIKRLIPIAETELEQDIKTPPPPVTPEQSAKPKKTGSLSIVFRKFYNLAAVRMDHLCNLLGITNEELKSKIWTVFEHAICLNTDLMKDRHLDQLLMCSVYVICKVTENSEINFTEIMRCYRQQPQADSHIYRNVLINRRTVRSDGTVTEEKRQDLICFYNSIYIQVMKGFALKFANNVSQGSNNVLLSPLPAPKSQLVSPRLQVVKNVYVKQFESPDAISLNAKSLHYYFSRSPSKDLKDINKAINNGVSGKRLLVDDGDLPNKRITNRKMQSLIEERRSQNTE